MNNETLQFMCQVFFTVILGGVATYIAGVCVFAVVSMFMKLLGKGGCDE